MHSSPANPRKPTCQLRFSPRGGHTGKPFVNPRVFTCCGIQSYPKSYPKPHADQTPQSPRARAYQMLPMRLQIRSSSLLYQLISSFSKQNQLGVVHVLMADFVCVTSLGLGGTGCKAPSVSSGGRGRSRGLRPGPPIVVSLRHHHPVVDKFDWSHYPETRVHPLGSRPWTCMWLCSMDDYAQGDYCARRTNMNMNIMMEVHALSE